MKRKIKTTEEFVEKTKEVHGDRYDYSKSEFSGITKKLLITCRKHGDFVQTAGIHLKGCGCPKCARDYGVLDFVSAARKVHGSKYDYSKVEYVNNGTKVCIICPIHGEFWQKPGHHIHLANGCPKCNIDVMRKKYTSTKNEFIQKAKKIHSDKYDYSKVEYVNGLTKIWIVCPVHGEFLQTPNTHLQGCGCPGCGKEKSHKSKPKKYTTTSFIEKSKEIWGEKYEYSKTEYISSNVKVIIGCPKHGYVNVLSGLHLNKNKFSGCPLCNTEENTRIQKENHRIAEEKKKKFRETPEEKQERLNRVFIEKAKKVYGDKYDYSKVQYKTNKDKVCIICPTHGEFWMRPNDHIDHKNACPMCGINGKRNKKYTQEEYVALAKEKFGGFYDYSKTVYKAMLKPITVTCPEHGDFIIRAMDHIKGGGCPEHHQKSTMELRVEKLLTDNNINFVYQKKFPWLGLQSLDFYLPDHHIGIECQGVQHFVPVELFGGENGLMENKKRDILKKELCLENGVKLLYYTEKKFVELVNDVRTPGFSRLSDLLFEIQKSFI